MNVKKDKKTTVALCGNPNSGKTTLFNLLTGSDQKVGNWPGVTVEKKTGVCKAYPDLIVADTPGVYSLTPFTPEERVARDYLLKEKPDVVINIVDSTNLERNLFLTTELLELDVPLVVALNMSDEAEAKGIVIDVSALERHFGCKFFCISAKKNKGVTEMLRYCAEQTVAVSKPLKYSQEFENAARSAYGIVKDRPHRRWLTLKLVCRDPDTLKTLNLRGSDINAANAIYERLKSSLKDDPSCELSKERYEKIAEALSRSVKTDARSANGGEKLSVTQKIDKIVLNKWLAFPIFVAVMTLVFFLSIDGIGGFLTDAVNGKLTPLVIDAAEKLLAQTSEPVRSLVCDGIICGVMSVAGFVPQIMILFGCIAALEASGYMARVAFITDRLLNKIGLGGRSFVSMILGCGCSVPAIMSTRTIKNKRERDKTVTLAPFVPCSAKLALISFFTAAVFKGNALTAISFYLISVLAVIFGGLILKLFDRKNDNANDVFIMELPSYRRPTAANIFKQMWERGKSFLIKAGTVIFAASILLWFAQRYDFGFNTADPSESILASIGKLLAPVFAPLGFGDGGYGWQFSVAALSGIAAKETVITSLEILLPYSAEQCISGLGAYSFVVYNLLTVPCVAAVSASFSEQGKLGGLKSAAFQFATAYAVSLTLYQGGKLLNKNATVFATAACVTVIAAALFFALRHMKNGRGAGCKYCSRECCPSRKCANKDIKRRITSKNASKPQK